MKTSIALGWLLAIAFLAIALVAGGLWAAGFTPEGLLHALIDQGTHSTAEEAVPDQVPPIPRGVVIEHVDESNFKQKVIDSPAPVLVDFYADWCGPCRLLAPRLEALAQEAVGVRIVKVDVDKSHSLAGEYEIQSIPCLILFRDSKPAARLVGLASLDQLRALVQGPAAMGTLSP